MPYVYSTLSNDNLYCTYPQDMSAKDGVHTPQEQILIRGKANVAQESNDKTLYTPRGVATFVTDEQLATLLKIDAFNFHVKGGYLLVDKTGKEINGVENAVKNMAAKDNSAPLTNSDFNFTEEEKAKPGLGKNKK
jgi:hypothetical protein